MGTGRAGGNAHGVRMGRNGWTASGVRRECVGNASGMRRECIGNASENLQLAERRSDDSASVLLTEDRKDVCKTIWALRSDDIQR